MKRRLCLLLVEHYPQSPIFLLLLGDMNAKLNRKEQAATSFRAAEKLPAHDPPCHARVQKLAQAALAALSETHGSP